MNNLNTMNYMIGALTNSINSLTARVSQLEGKVSATQSTTTVAAPTTATISDSDLRTVKEDIRKYVDDQLSLLDRKISMVNSQIATKIQVVQQTAPPMQEQPLTPEPMASNATDSFEKTIEEELQQSATDDFTISTKKKAGRKVKK